MGRGEGPHHLMFIIQKAVKRKIKGSRKPINEKCKYKNKSLQTISTDSKKRVF